MADEYFLWDAYEKKFWKPNKYGYTMLVNVAGRYSAEEAVSIANNLNTPGQPLAVTLLKAPKPGDVKNSLDHVMRYGGGKLHGKDRAAETSEVEPAFFLWRDSDARFWGTPPNAMTSVTHRARRFTAEEAMKAIEESTLPLIPVPAPPPGVALLAFFADATVQDWKDQ